MTARKAKRQPKARRASQRLVISIDLAETRLRHLMTEQCRNGGSYITVYCGSRAELIAAGVPEKAFPNGGPTVLQAEFTVQTVNVCCTGSHELLKGLMLSTSSGYELEIDWGYVRPYMQAAHPAVMELARMLLKDVLAWTSHDSARPDLAHTMGMLAADPRAVDYKPRAGAPRLQVTPDFDKELRSQAMDLFEFVHSNCEVLPCVETGQLRQPQHLRLVRS